MGFPVWNFTKGKYRVRFSDASQDVDRCLALRAEVFRGDAGADDRDAFDARCCHVLIEDASTAALVCCFRILPLANGAALQSSYAARSYDLSSWQAYQGRLLEIGRFCVAEHVSDPDVVRIAWGALTAYVDGEDVSMLIGCSSFPGIKVAPHHAVFKHLYENHIGPEHMRPAPKAAQTVPLNAGSGISCEDGKRALATMPPLLRSYLLMGGWVSDHAVVDHDLDTLHVFTAVEVAAIPEARKRLLRAVRL